MAHNLEIKNGKASFAAVGEKAWHGLGTYVDQAMTAKEAIELGGLGFTVEKQPVYLAGGIEIPNVLATVRADNNTPLGLVSPGYHVVQNSDAFEFFDTIIDRGEAVYQTAGVLGKGEKVFITAKLPNDILVHGEQVENYILLTLGHDGKTSVQAGFTGIRVVCNNTLQAALSGLQNKATIFHFPNAKSKLQAASKIMGISSRYTQELDQIFNKMAGVKVTDQKLRAYIEEVMKPQKETISKQTLEAEHSKFFTKTVASIMDFAHTHDTQLTEAAKGTVWGAYNAISGYFGYVKSYKNQGDKMGDLYYGKGAKRIENAFSLALDMAS